MTCVQLDKQQQQNVHKHFKPLHRASATTDKHALHKGAQQLLKTNIVKEQ